MPICSFATVKQVAIGSGKVALTSSRQATPIDYTLLCKEAVPPYKDRVTLGHISIIIIIMYYSITSKYTM